MSPQQQKLQKEANEAGLMLLWKYNGNRIVWYILRPFVGSWPDEDGSYQRYFHTQQEVKRGIQVYVESIPEAVRSYNKLVANAK